MVSPRDDHPTELSAQFPEGTVWDFDAPIGPQFHIETLAFRRSIPSPDVSVISLSYGFHTQCLKCWLRSGT